MQGTFHLPFGNAEKSLELIAGFIRQLLINGKIPVGMGGEHLVSWPVMRTVADNYEI